MMVEDDVLVVIRTSALSVTVLSREIFFLAAGNLKAELLGNSLSLLLSALTLSVLVSAFSFSLPLGVMAAASAISSSISWMLTG